MSGGNHTDPNRMSLSASFPGAELTSSIVRIVDVGVDILANCSPTFFSLDKVATASVIRTGPFFYSFPPPLFFFLIRFFLFFFSARVFLVDFFCFWLLQDKKKEMGEGRGVGRLKKRPSKSEF